MVFRCRNSRHPLHQLRDEVDRLFGGFAESLPEAAWPRAGRGQPAVNLYQDGDTLFAELEVPGISREQLDVSVVGDQLSIKAERPDAGQEGVTYHRQERSVGGLSRVLSLPAEIDASRVKAELNHGVLTISLPKAESAKPRKIDVTSA